MGALEKSTRRKLFYAMVVLFAILAPLILLYSRGYVLDLQHLGFVETGGIFVKTALPGARIFVDGALLRETSFIARGALITNLEPRRYALKVEQEGFRPWSKLVRVTGEEVTEFRNILLPPATITPQVIFVTRQAGSSRLAALDGRAEVGLEVGDAGGPFTVFVVDPAQSRAPINLIRVSSWFWDDQAQAFFIGRRDEGVMRWFRLPGIEPTAGEIPIAFRGLPAGFAADSVRSHPQDPELLYFFAGGVLFLQGRASVPVPIAEQVHAYALTADRLYTITRTGFFVVSNLDGGEARVLGRKGLFLDPADPARISVTPAGDALVRDSAGGLFWFEPGSHQELEAVAGNAAGFDLSAKGDRLLYWDEHRLWLWWLRDNRDQPFDLARTKKQLFFSEEPILSAFLNEEGTHVFFATPTRVRMAEVDDRSGQNTYDLASGEIDSFLLDKGNLTLYWAEGSKVWRARLK